MNKLLSSCVDCGKDNLALKQFSSGLEIIFLCSDCNSLRYLNEVKKEIRYTKKKEFNYYGLGKFNYFIFKFICARFKI